MSNSITPNYTLTGSQGTLTVSGPANVTYGGVSYPPHTPVAEPDMERIIDLQTELVLTKEKLDVAIKVIADLFESKPTLELSEQAKMRHDLAEIIDDLLERAAAKERALEDAKERSLKERMNKVSGSIFDKAEPWPTYASQDVRLATRSATQSPLQYYVDANSGSSLTTDDLRRIISEEFDSRWHK